MAHHGDRGRQDRATSPPAGTGHAPGLGEAFSINFSAPARAPTASARRCPTASPGTRRKLSLEYVHGAGHGAFGLGWRLPLRTISQRLDFGAPDDAATTRFLDGGTEIAPLADGTFAALAESSVRPLHAQGARLADRGAQRASCTNSASAPARASPIRPTRSARMSGCSSARSMRAATRSTYTWRIDQGIAYLSEIRYAAYAVRFSYEPRPDVRDDGRAGYLRRRALRCTRDRARSSTRVR